MSEMFPESNAAPLLTDPQEIAHADATAKLTVSLSSAIKTNPDEMARYGRLAKATGFDPLLIQQDDTVRTEAERRGALAEINPKGMVQTHPNTAKWLTLPVNAMGSHDDVSAMQGLEDAWSNTWRSLSAGSLSLGAAAVDVAAGVLTGMGRSGLSADEASVLFKGHPEIAAKALEEEKQFALAKQQHPLSVLARAIQARSTEVMAGTPEQYRTLEYATLDPSKSALLSPVKLLGDALRSIPMTLPLVASAVLTRGAASRATATATTEAAKLGYVGAEASAFIKAAAEQAATRVAGISSAAGEAAISGPISGLQAEEQALKEDITKSPYYQELLAQNYTPEQAHAAAIAKAKDTATRISMIAVAAVNFAAGKYLADALVGQTSVVRGALAGVKTEMVTEGVQSPLETLGANYAIQKFINPEQELSKGVGESFVQGAVVGGLTGGAIAGGAAWVDQTVARAAETERKVQRGVAAYETLTQLSQAAATVKLRDRDPAAFKQFMQTMVDESPITELFVDAKALQETLAQAPIETQQLFAQEMPEVMAQLSEAVATEGLVRLPVADYASHIAGGDLDASILPHLKAEADGLTYAQAQEHYKTQEADMLAEAEKIAQDHSDDAVYQEDSQKVHDTILGYLESTKRFTPDVLKKYAALRHAYFVTKAAKRGIMPSELMARFDGRVTAERTGGAELDQDAAPLANLPAEVNVDGVSVMFGPYAPARAAAQAYSEATGIPYAPPAQYVKVDPARARRIAAAYEAMPHAPNDPEVRAAYEALAVETLAQWKAIEATGLKVEFFPEGKDTYGNPRNAILDVLNNNHLFIFPTEAGYGMVEQDQTGNPMLAPVPGATFGGQPVLLNDLFRVVHDYFGHAKEGVGFRADGEENAWRIHSAMFSPLAQRALTTETRGQNSWLNYGPHAEFNKTASGQDTIYAEQKIGLLPEWVSQEGLADVSPAFGYRARDAVRKATMEDFTAGRVGNILRQTDWAILTAELDTLTPEENAARNAELKDDLARFEHAAVDGVYTQADEKSFVVTGVTRAQARALGDKYGQETVLTRDGLVYEDGSVAPATGVTVHATRPKEYFTTLPDGTMFTADIDFDHKVTPTNADRVGEARIEAVHFSRAPRPTLDGRYVGTGVKAEERARLAHADPRVKTRIDFYYGRDIRPEAGVGPFRHDLTLTNMYDGGENPLRLPYENTPEGMNGFEKAVVDAGFDGYFTSRGRAVLLGKASEAVQVDTPPQGTEYRQEAEEYEVLTEKQRDLPISDTELAALRHDAAAIEAPEQGITFRITEDGKGIVAGPKGVKVPDRFKRFVDEKKLVLVVQRRQAFSAPMAVFTGEDTTKYDLSGGTYSEKPMPIEYRAGGALYFGEIGATDRGESNYFQPANEIYDNQLPEKLSPQNIADMRKVWAIYAASEGPVAQYGASSAQAASLDNEGITANFTEIVNAVFPFGAPVVKDITRFYAGTEQVPEGAYAVRFTSPTSDVAEAVINPADKSLMLNIVGWKAGRGGSAIYKVMLEFARNNGFVFYGDTAGLSPSSKKRRLENLLSHAIQSGDTSYMRLHPHNFAFIEQETGEPLVWKDGDHKNNIEQMLNASYNLTNLDIPGLKNVYFDLAQRQFVDSRTGGAVTNFQGYIAEARGDVDILRREGAAGLTTAQRAAFVNTILRARSEEARQHVFAAVARLALDSLPGAERLLYQKADPKPTFYSALTRAVETHQQKKGTPDQWIGILKNLTQKGIKAEELEWTGILDWLEARKTRADSWIIREDGVVVSSRPATDPKPEGAELFNPSKSVTREEIVEYLEDEGAVVVTPKVLSGGSTLEFSWSGRFETEEPDMDYLAQRAAERVSDMSETQLSDWMIDAVDIPPDEQEGDAEAEIGKLYAFIHEKGEASASTRQLYDTLLEKLTKQEEDNYRGDSDSPSSRTIAANIGDRSFFFDDRRAYGERSLYAVEAEGDIPLPQRADDADVEQAIRLHLEEKYGIAPNDAVKYGKYVLPGGEGYAERLQIVPVGFFSSSHFAEDNIAAHTRVDDRRVSAVDLADTFPELAARLTAEGRGAKVYFIEEVQSDWAQRGRKRSTEQVRYKREELTLDEAATAGRAEDLDKTVVAEVINDQGNPSGMYAVFEKESIARRGPAVGYSVSPPKDSREQAEYDRLRFAGAHQWAIKTSDQVFHVNKKDFTTAERAMDHIVDTKTRSVPSKTTSFEDAKKRAVLEKQIDALHTERRLLIASLPVEVRNAADSPGIDALSYKMSTLQDEKERLPRGVGAGPFVESTDSWVSLVLKDAIREAAAGGYDLISWTTGDQQVERWSGGLRERVDSIKWEKSAEGVIHIRAQKFGSDVANTKYGENDLAAAIGKVMAQRIIEDPNQTGEITGSEITVADLGMVKFYGDEHGNNPDGKPAIFTKVANQVLKKLGGDKVRNLEADKVNSEEFSSQPAFEITDKMREIAMQGQPLFQKNRGTFNPDTLTTSLLKDADLSTFLHETGHFFLEIESRMAADVEATQAEKDDFNKVLHWLGVADLKTWQNMTFEEKRPYHEKYARGFEAYLFEGKAPSTALTKAFNNFKEWLKQVYVNLTNLNVELTDEVRGVFDRMLASDEQVAEAEKRRAMVAANIESLTAPERAAYLALDGDASDEAATTLRARSLRDMKWLSNARSRVLKDLQKEAASKRKEVRAEVTAEVMAEPINKARTFLRKGEMVAENGDLVKADKGFRLDTAVLAEMYPETMLARPDLTNLRGMTMKDGLHPDLVADMFGLPSGDSLVRNLIEGENAKEKIDGLTDQRMLERYGDLIDQKAIERAADEAVHNDARARFMATGLKALSESPLPVAQIVAAAKETADIVIAAKKVRDIKPLMYEAAETKANKEVLKHAAKDVEKAKRAQRAALLNNRLAKAAIDALEEVRKGVDRMNRVQRAAAQSNMRGEYLAQLNALLERFDLRKSTTLKAIDAQRTPLATWIEAESERLSAVLPDLPEWVLNEGTRMHYKEMTVEQFRGLVDAMKQLELMARREEKQYQAIRGMKFKEERTALLDRIRQFHPEAFGLDGEPLGMSPKFVKHLGDTVKELGDKFAGEFLNAETLVGLLEGGEFGLVHESLIGRMSTRADWKATRMGEIYEQVKPLFAQYSLKERYDFSRKDIAAGIGMSLTRENALLVALLHGNREGRERLANYGWGNRTQQAIVNLLDERDMAVAQGIWDLFDNDLWPELKALNDRTRGKSPPKVEAVAVVSNGKTYRGGYFRLKYDTDLDERAHRLDEGAAVKELLGGGLGMSAKTGQGASTERKENVTMRPRLDLGVFSEAVAETVHDLAYREAVADTMRMLNDVRVQNTIKTAAGTPAYRALVTRVREIAAPPRNPSGWIELPLTIARKNTIVTLMSGVNTALQNFTGFVSSTARVSPGRLVKEIALFYSPKMKERMEFAMSQSAYMRNRHSAFERDMQNEIQKMTVNARIMPDTSSWLVLMGLVDKGTSIPVWNTAFSDGMGKFDNDVAKSVEYADHVVRQTQGSGRELDVAQIMSGHGGYGQLKRIFTMFYSYFNAQLGMLVRSGAVNARLAKSNPGLAAAKFTKDFMLVFVLPAVLTQMIFKSDQGDDPDEWMKKYMRVLAMYGMAMVPLLRDVGSFAWSRFDHDVKNYGFKITPVESAFVGVVEGTVSAKDIVSGEGDDTDLKNLIMGTSYAVGLPGAQIKNTVMGTKAWVEGEAGPQAVVFGPPKK